MCQLWAEKSAGFRCRLLTAENGYLVDTVEQAAEKTMCLLKNREMAKQMGVNGKEHVRENFLIISQLRDYLKLYADLLNEAEKKEGS